MKKAQGLSLNTIVIAIIVLFVLVILLAIFGTRMGLWGKDLTTETKLKYCEDVPEDEVGTSVNGIIRSITEGCQVGEIELVGSYKDIGVTQVCCVSE